MNSVGKSSGKWWGSRFQDSIAWSVPSHKLGNVAGQIVATIVVQENRPGVRMAAESLNRPDVAIGLVECAGDRLVSEAVGPGRFRKPRLAAEIADDQKHGGVGQPVGAGGRPVEADEERTRFEPPCGRPGGIRTGVSVRWIAPSA
jgi:hypothetical protein